MIKYILLFLPLFGFGTDIKIENVQLKPLGKIIKTNAEITQLSNQKQEIVSKLSGHLEQYFVHAGEEVKNAQKVALVESIELSKMTAEYLSLVQQKQASKMQKDTTMKLYKKGLSSQNDLNNAIIALEEIQSKQNALASQLKSLGFDPLRLTEATDKLVIYAHADGIVGKIAAPLHSNVNAQTLLMTLVNQSTYHAVAYLGTKDAMILNKKTTAWIKIAQKRYPADFVHLLPVVDSETQRAKALFKIKNTSSTLLMGAFVEIEISLSPNQEAIMVKKSALTLFNGEWVIFVPKDHQAYQEHMHDTHSMEKTENHANNKHKDAHGDTKEKEIPYEPHVVEIIAYAGDEVAIRGLQAGMPYVSDGVYFIKSMLLKSALGEHGH